ncbi:MAG: DUF4345 domain-containing protein [Xanthomonadales bacterium]|nr:DUF4345 domain-containing protein [Xanthomonadales bacterium]
MARLILALSALGLLGFGVWMLIAPQAILAAIGIALQSEAALTEIRAFYGGLEIGLGLALLFCLRSPGWLRPGLALSALCYGCVALCRAGGMLVDGSGGGFLLGALAFEASLCVACVWALRADRGKALQAPTGA